MRRSSRATASDIPPVSLKDLVPPEIRERKSRAESFMANLTPQQRSIFWGWMDQGNPEDVAQWVAAPPPAGFGIQVPREVIARLECYRTNAKPIGRIMSAMESACDIADRLPNNPALLRETLLLQLYSSAVHQTAFGMANFADINHILRAITRLEKIRARHSATHQPSPSRLKVDLTLGQPEPNSIDVISAAAASVSFRSQIAGLTAGSHPVTTFNITGPASDTPAQPIHSATIPAIDAPLAPRLASSATSYKMLPVIENLLILQDRDRKIMRIEAELANLAPERAALDQRAQRAQAQSESAKQKARQLEADRKKLELEVEAKKGLIEKYSLQQFQTKKNEEYKALAHEIDVCKQAISKLDDEQLVLMEQIDVANREAADTGKLSASELKDVELARAALVDKEARLKRELADLKSDYARLEQAVDESARERYIRLRKQRGATTVVGIDRGICGGCHMKLPMQVVLSCQAQQEIVTCPQCSRILYFTREMDLAVA
jgi:predicted  nucleic acid-binding Zn-ribbon protein